MAVASAKTKLPLTTWGRLMNMHPLHFEQVRIEQNPHCDQVMFQYAWQNADHASREDIAQAIAETEYQIETYLQYRLARSWEVDEWRGTIRPFQANMVNYNSRDIRGFNQLVAADWGYFISGGVEAKLLIEAGAAIVFTDEDMDGYFETATVSVATDVIDVNEISIYYPGNDGEDEWEIRPTQVQIAAGIATITFRREQVVNPDLFRALFNIEGAEAIGTDDADFLSTVDVYRHYNDPQTQSVMLWEPNLNRFCSNCNGEMCSQCAFNAATACLLIRGDPRQSLVVYNPADWDVATQSFTPAFCNFERQPDIVRLYYQAGFRDKRQRYIDRMSPDWERAVAYMAAAKLSRPPCDCAAGDWNKWSEDLTIIAGNENANAFYRTPDGILDNPFGTRRGEVYAWRRVKTLMRGRGILVA